MFHVNIRPISGLCDFWRGFPLFFCRLSQAHSFPCPKIHLMYGDECLTFEDRKCLVRRCVRKMVLCPPSSPPACTLHPGPHTAPLLPAWHCQMHKKSACCRSFQDKERWRDCRDQLEKQSACKCDSLTWPGVGRLRGRPAMLH